MRWKRYSCSSCSLSLCQCSLALLLGDFHLECTLPGRVMLYFLFIHVWNCATASKERQKLFLPGLKSCVPVSPPSFILPGRLQYYSHLSSKVWVDLPGPTQRLRSMVVGIVSMCVAHQPEMEMSSEKFNFSNLAGHVAVIS